ncbi:MAG: TRAP transporter large permease subunit, partial [Pseudomonadota bacterium]
MDIATVSILIVLAMTALLVMGVPVAFVSGSIAVVLAVSQFGLGGLFLISSRTAEFVQSFTLIAVPMFVIMAAIMERSGVAADLYRAFHVLAGGLRGGLGVVTTFVAVILGATTGIIGGEIVLLGLIALPQMLRLGYDRRLAIGTITAGGSLGTMIPPSIILIFYGLTAEVSISHLFLATLMPGLMLAGFYIAYILIRCGLNPAMGPPLTPEERDMPLAEKLKLFGG